MNNLKIKLKEINKKIKKELTQDHLSNFTGNQSYTYLKITKDKRLSSTIIIIK